MPDGAASKQSPSVDSSALMVTVFLAMVAMFAAVLASAPKQQQQPAVTIPAIAALTDQRMSAGAAVDSFTLPADFFADDSVALTHAGQYWLGRIARAAQHLRTGEIMRLSVLPPTDSGEVMAIRAAALATALAALGVRSEDIELASVPAGADAHVTVVGDGT